jgi:hypothetical protein
LKNWWMSSLRLSPLHSAGRCLKRHGADVTRTAFSALHRDSRAVRATAQFEILGAVVTLNAVDVMHLLEGGQRSSEPVRHDRPMLGHVAAHRSHRNGDGIIIPRRAKGRTPSAWSAHHANWDALLAGGDSGGSKNAHHPRTWRRTVHRIWRRPAGTRVSGSSSIRTTIVPLNPVYMASVHLGHVAYLDNILEQRPDVLTRPYSLVNG